ncbi:hypothetical protein AWENTII_011968 [Aspergillus wentii]
MVEEDCGQETIAACGRSIPFYWPELDQIGGRVGLSTHPEVLKTLPDGGYDAILTRGFNQFLSRQGLLPPKPPSAVHTIKPHPVDYIDDICYRSEHPNALSAISITVHPARRSVGLAEAMIQAMKLTAMNKGLEMLVVPLRPTRKSEYPLVNMAKYINWHCQQYAPDRSLPFDPWLRKHVRLGGKVIQVAWNSMLIEGSIAAWQQWTQFDKWRVHSGSLKLEKGTNRLYIEVSFTGGLVPMRLYVGEDRCTYVEPNVWLYHDLNV